MIERMRVLKEDQDIRRNRFGPVIYWMSRDQRSEDHWGLIYARGQAEILRTFLVVVFCIAPNYLMANQSHYQFMIQGLKEVAIDLENKGIPFHVIQGKPHICIPKLISEWDASMLVVDFNPLRINRDWENQITEVIDCAVHQVDSHNIVPCWKASDKLEYAAYTFRPRIMKKLKEYMTDYPPVASQKVSAEWFVRQNWEWTIEARSTEKQTFPFQSGKKAAFAQLNRFLKKGIHQYGEESNQPLSHAVSRLSPNIHFGQISTQRIALEIIKNEVEGINQEAFLEQLIIRRELSDNFCFYQPLYDQPVAFPRWARETLSQHENDQREYLYTREELESAATHDMLWNAAQLEMKWTGYLHGYLRMYWAKKILEWSPAATIAQQVAIYLNDTYLLDGRDPNGYTGIAWSIGGVHDRAWAERSIFGKIRYMNSRGCRRKFDVDAYITSVYKEIEKVTVK